MEIGESLVGAYLKHIVGCDVVLFNTHLADVQGELDVVGVKTMEDGSQRVWLVEVTTHLLGMLYKTQNDTVTKVLEKKRRAEQFASKLFDAAEITFEVWSPIVSSGTVKGLESAGISLICNEHYTDRINALAEHASKSTQTTGDDGYRLLQLLTHLRGKRPRFEFDKGFEPSGGEVKFVSVPNADAPSAVLFKFAHTYEAYDRLVADLNVLQEIYSSHIENFNRANRLDRVLGIDFLRGFLFVIARTDHFTEGFWNEHIGLVRQIIAAIREKAGLKVLDLR